MIEGEVLLARRAHTARLAILAVGAVNVLSHGAGKRKFACSGCSVNEESMRNGVGIDDVTNVGLCSLVAYNVAEIHCC